MSPPDTRIQELHLTLPPVPKPIAKYRPAVQVGNMLYLSGHGYEHGVHLVQDNHVFRLNPHVGIRCRVLACQ